MSREQCAEKRELRGVSRVLCAASCAACDVQRAACGDNFENCGGKGFCDIQKFAREILSCEKLVLGGYH